MSGHLHMHANDSSHYGLKKQLIAENNLSK